MSSADQLLADVQHEHEVQAGERCPRCHRRKPKPPRDTSPEVGRVTALLPYDRKLALEELLETLQEWSGVDPHSFPRGSLLEALAVLGVQQREELRRYFKDRVQL